MYEEELSFIVIKAHIEGQLLTDQVIGQLSSWKQNIQAINGLIIEDHIMFWAKILQLTRPCQKISVNSNKYVLASFPEKGKIGIPS